MESNYSATTGDFEAIEEALGYVFDPRLNYIFKDKDYLKKISIIGFDSKFIYIWSFKKLKNFLPHKRGSDKHFMYKISHNIEIKNVDRAGWRAGIWPSSINEYLPLELQGNDFDNPKISGSLLGDFINNQIIIYDKKNNPYVTKESYLATIIHEYGHIYYQQRKNWWFSDKKMNIDILETALSLYKRANKKKYKKIKLPFPFLFSEVFAFCAEYSASKLFFPIHIKNINKYAITVIRKSIKEENRKNLETEDSVFSEHTPHILAFALGKILFEKFPNTWPKKLLNKSSL